MSLALLAARNGLIGAGAFDLFATGSLMLGLGAASDFSNLASKRPIARNCAVIDFSANARVKSGFSAK
jgi:hypothetical protein